MNTKELYRAFKKLANSDLMSDFEPNKMQNRAKIRFIHNLSEQAAVLDKESLTLDDIAKLADTDRVKDWAVHSPNFLPWFLDLDRTGLDLQAHAEAAIKLLRDIMDAEPEPKILTAKDKVNAANILLQLADRFPSKRKEIRWLDQEVGKLTEGEVQKQIEEYKKKLIGSEEKS